MHIERVEAPFDDPLDCLLLANGIVVNLQIRTLITVDDVELRKPVHF